MKQKIEILAPAGSYEGMKAAMNAGCDAVYIGGSSFGARAYANNLNEETLLRAIDEAHIRGKSLYLTVNTLLKEKEHTGELYAFLERFYLQGLDAVIVQDVGVLHFIHEHFPELPIHASTQMTLTMAQGANLLKDYGVTRLVTSRELNLREIKNIRDHTELEIETFVHGALCYCYSGQCLMSSIIGGRSGNRGRCAQPCRMPYQFYSEGKKLSSEQEKYLLSPKDINTIEIIPELIEAGINSFKIEGRMKRPEYAAAVAHMYRKYTDLYLNHGKDAYLAVLESKEYERDMTELQDVYNRGGFSQGYSKTHNGKKMMSLYRPNHSGVLVGEVKEIKGSQVGIWLKEEINAQDILEIRHIEEEGYEFTVKDPHQPGDILRTNVGRRPDSYAKVGVPQNGKKVKYSLPQIHIGDPVYRTKNNELLEYLEKEYLKKEKQYGISGLLKARLGEKLKLTLSAQDVEITVYQDTVQEALKQPMSKEKLVSSLEKTGDTLFYFEHLQIEADENIFVPVAWLNEIRREGISLLEEAIIKKSKRIIPENLPTNEKKYEELPETSLKEPDFMLTDSENDLTLQNVSGKDKGQMGLSVSVALKEQFEITVNTDEVVSIFAEYDAFTNQELVDMAITAKEKGKAYYLSLPHICRLAVYEGLKKDLPGIIKKEEITGFLVKNFEEIALLQSLGLDEGARKELILNHNMYTYNREAKQFWREKGIFHFTAPVELNYQELRMLGIHDADLLVYGYLPLMISSQCLFESTGGCKRKAGGANKTGERGCSGNMVDRLGKAFYVRTNCDGCYNIIYNVQVLALHKQADEILGLKPRNIRLDFTKENLEQTKKIISLFVDKFINRKKNAEELSDYTTGHFKRGVE